MRCRFDRAARSFSRGTRASRALVAACAILLAALEGSAAADLQVDAKWRQGALREEFTVQQWLPGCGPEPQSATTGGGEPVAIRVEGDELALVGGGRVYRTNQCYDPMPNLSRETHARDANGKTWRTRCATPPNDPRKAILNTLVVATTDTHIDLVETGRYEITLASGRCIADIKRTRGFDVVRDEAPSLPKPEPAPAPKPKPKPDPKPAVCAAPGEPSRLEVRPSKKLLRTGESFQFRPVVLDDKGCATQTATSWKLAPGAEGKGVSVSANGLAAVAEGAQEGSIELVATAAGKETRVVVQISQPDHYSALLEGEGLNASGETDVASVVAIGSQSLGGGSGTVEDRARMRRMIFLGVIGAVLVVLGGVAMVLLRRSRRAAALARDAEQLHEERVREVLERRRVRADQHAAQQRAHEESVAAARAVRAAREQAARGRAEAAAKATDKETRACPACNREFEPPTGFCPHDGTRLVPQTAGKRARMCPACNRTFGAGVTVCPHDREQLVALPPPDAMGRTTSTKRGKICPSCGERFDGAAEFCGKDGTQLVLLN